MARDRCTDHVSGIELNGIKQSGKKCNEWYKRGSYDSVLFVPCTPNSQLKKAMDVEILRSGYRVRTVERAGTTMKRMIQRSDPF